MNDRELLEFIAAQVGVLNGKVDGIEKKVDSIDNRLIKIETTIENEIKPDIKLSLQGYHDVKEDITKLNEKMDTSIDKINWVKDEQKMNSITLKTVKFNVENIEKEVSKHDDIIFKRIK